jgi:inhibitor of cysteine peptidase
VRVVAWILWVTLSLLLMPLSDCQASDGAGSLNGEKGISVMTLTQADNGKAVMVRSGEKIVLRLNENPTTGFQWALEQDNDEIVELVESDYIQAPSAGVGAGGQHVWTFKAKKSGSARIALKLWRAWEGDKSITERFEVTIHVTG